MPVTFFIAFRFLFQAARIRQIGLFTLVSLCGIMASVMLFLVIDSIINGLTLHLKESLIGFEAPLFLSVDKEQLSTIPRSLQDFIKKQNLQNVVTVPSSQFDGLIHVPQLAPMGVRARSVTKDFFELKQDQLDVYWFEGYSPETFEQSSELVVLGEKVYEHLQFFSDEDEVAVITHPFADVGPTGELEPADKAFVVAGFFSTGRSDFDERYVLLSSAGILSLASEGMLEHQLFIFPNKEQDVSVLQTAWNQQSSVTPIKTWYEKNQNLFKAIQLEKLLYMMIFLFILLISCFNLTALITIFSMNKIRDSAHLNMIGLSLKQIRLVFVFIGFLLGCVGTILGLGLGLVLVTVAKMSGLSLPEAYGFTQLPLAINLQTVLILLFGTPLLAAVVSVIPAARLTTKRALDVMRLT